MAELAQQKCTPCQGGVDPLTEQEATNMLAQTPEWSLIENATKIRREFKFQNFVEALEFTNNIGEIAEQEGHHPDLELGWGYVNVTVQTHKIGGLHENDFIYASKVDAVA